MSNDDLNDDLSDLLSGNLPPRPAPVLPASYKPVAELVEEPCPKCRGTGRFVSYSGRLIGGCFTCNGTGKRTFKNSFTDRAKARTQVADRKARKTADAILSFQEREPEVFAWLNDETAKERPFPFAVSMVESLAKWHDLTDKQLETCKRLAAKANERKAERAARVDNAPVVDAAGVDRLKAAFDAAVAYSAEKGLKLSPRLTIDGITISVAKATSANPGALYVKSGGEYLGKIVNAKFYATAACTTEHEAKLALFLTNPAEAAKVYGQTTGTCCVCNATLISKWKHRGIGPICAEKFGW